MFVGVKYAQLLCWLTHSWGVVLFNEIRDWFKEGILFPDQVLLIHFKEFFKNYEFEIFILNYSYVKLQ